MSTNTARFVVGAQRAQRIHDLARESFGHRRCQSETLLTHRIHPMYELSAKNFKHLPIMLDKRKPRHGNLGV